MTKLKSSKQVINKWNQQFKMSVGLFLVVCIEASLRGVAKK